MATRHFNVRSSKPFKDWRQAKSIKDTAEFVSHENKRTCFGEENSEHMSVLSDLKIGHTKCKGNCRLLINKATPSGLKRESLLIESLHYGCVTKPLYHFEQC